MKLFWRLFFSTIALLFLPIKADAYRVALIIGNDAYANINPLNNAVNDARLIARTLRDLGFTDVRLVSNVTSQDLSWELETFMQRSAGAEVAMIYFAGHGFALDSRAETAPESGKVGYVLATDWNGDSFGGIAMANLLVSVRKASRGIVVVDACRSDFPRSGDQVLITNALLNSRLGGVASMDPMKKNILFVASTANGQTASDGPSGTNSPSVSEKGFVVSPAKRQADGPSGANSPFALAFAKRITEQGANEKGFGERLTKDVRDATGGAQTPFYMSQLENVGNPLLAGNDGRPPFSFARPALLKTVQVSDGYDGTVDAKGRLVVAGPQGVSIDGRLFAAKQQKLSPDGSKALRLADGQVSVSDADGRRSTHKREVHGGLYAGDVANDGRYVVFDDDYHLVGYNALLKGYWPKMGERITRLALSEVDAFVYYLTGTGQLCAYDTHMFTKLWCQRDPTFWSIREAPGAKTLMTLTERSAELRTTEGGYVFKELEFAGSAKLTSANYSPDGRYIVFGHSSGSVSIWNAESASRLAEIQSTAGEVRGARFSADGSKVVIVRARGAVEVWGF